MIVIPDDIDLETGSDWSSRNAELAVRRLEKVAGTGSEWVTAQSLEKAQGCP
jgi:hypothetical protein